ncbi:TolC family protein [Aquiflexum sp.]|uniref:TolC family protein n=1 Tax=Aquiflexum sp. TaxID=1872584 RepID=UPI00359402FE
MRYSIKQSLMLIWGSWIVFTANAQEKQFPITLEAVMQQMQTGNLTIQRYQEQISLAQANYTLAKEWWVPELYGGVSTFQLWGAAMNADGRFFLDVNAENLWAGIGLQAQWDFSEAVYLPKSARLQMEAAAFQSTAARNQSILQSIKTYYALLLAQQELSAYTLLHTQAEVISNQIAVQVEAGMLYESELLMAQSNARHLKVNLTQARKNSIEKSSKLAEILNLDYGILPVAADTVLMPIQLEGMSADWVSFGNMDYPVLLDEAFAKRPELKAVDAEYEATVQQKHRLTKGLWLPHLEVGTYTSYFGGLRGEVEAMFPDQFPETRQLYPTQFLMANLQWKIPLGRLFYGGEIKQADSRMALKELERDTFKAKINQEVLLAGKEIYWGREQVKDAKEGLELASRALDQSIKRQEIGTAKPFEVFQAQQFFLQAQLDYLRSVSEYNQAQFALLVAVGNNL